MRSTASSAQWTGGVAHHPSWLNRPPSSSSSLSSTGRCCRSRSPALIARFATMRNSHVRNDDRPGMIGRVGTIVGEAGINVSDMRVGRSFSGEAALMMIAWAPAAIMFSICAITTRENGPRSM